MKKLYLNHNIVNELARRYVPLKILLFLNKKKIIDISLGNQIEKNTPSLFCDILDYPNQMRLVIKKYNGSIDTLKGDGIKAFFPEGVDSAVQAAIEMQQEFHRLNIEICILIHTGDTKMKTSTDISDLTKEYGMSISLNENSFVQLDDPNFYNFRFIGKISVQAKKEPIALFDFFDGDKTEIKEMKIDSKSSYENSVFNYYSNRFAEAIAGFYTTLKLFPGDKASIKYIDLAKKKMNQI